MYSFALSKVESYMNVKIKVRKTALGQWYSTFLFAYPKIFLFNFVPLMLVYNLSYRVSNLHFNQLNKLHPK
jgi:hypothetical protein